jgi:hypothetical protein
LSQITSTGSFLGNAGIADQEKSVVRALLRGLGISFGESAFAKLSGCHVDVQWVAALVPAILVMGQSGTTIGVTKRRNFRKGGAEQYFVLREKWGKLLPGIYGKRGRSVFPYSCDSTDAMLDACEAAQHVARGR